MIIRKLKLKLNAKQESELGVWLPILTSVYNWAIKKIENDAKYGIYYTPFGFQNLLNGHSKKLNVPSHTIQAMLSLAYNSWQRCFKKISRKPRLKGRRNIIPVNSSKTTMTCSNCCSLTGPAGWGGLAVRNWECSACGAIHDRDINSAVVVLNSGAGAAHKESINGLN